MNDHKHCEAKVDELCDEIERLRAEVAFLQRIVDAANDHEGDCSEWKHLRAALDAAKER